MFRIANTNDAELRDRDEADADVDVARAPSAWRAAIFSRAAGQALLLPLIALALAALLAEAWLSGR